MSNPASAQDFWIPAFAGVTITPMAWLTGLKSITWKVQESPEVISRESLGVTLACSSQILGSML